MIVQDLKAIKDYDIVIIGHPLEEQQLLDLISVNEYVFDLVGNHEIKNTPNYSGIYW